MCIIYVSLRNLFFLRQTVCLTFYNSQKHHKPLKPGSPDDHVVAPLPAELAVEDDPLASCRYAFTSPSVGISTRMVVLDSTQLLRAVRAFSVSSRELYRTRAIPWLRRRWNSWRGPCWRQRVFRVEPSI